MVTTAAQFHRVIGGGIYSAKTAELRV